MKQQLAELASQISDTMLQAEFIADWTGKVSQSQLQDELNILIAEIWECECMVKAMLGQPQPQPPQETTEGKE